MEKDGYDLYTSLRRREQNVASQSSDEVHESLGPQKTLIPKIKIHAVKSFIQNERSDSNPLSIGNLLLQRSLERLRKQGHLQDSETTKDKQVREFLENSERQEHSERSQYKTYEESQTSTTPEVKVVRNPEIEGGIPSSYRKNALIGFSNSGQNSGILSNPRKSGQIGIFGPRPQSATMTENWKRMFSI